jgi:hypothetical protein
MSEAYGQGTAKLQMSQVYEYFPSLSAAGGTWLDCATSEALLNGNGYD